MLSLFEIYRRDLRSLTPGLFCPAVTFLMPCFQSPLLLERRLFSKVRAADVHCDHRKGGEMRMPFVVLLESVGLSMFFFIRQFSKLEGTLSLWD